MHEFLSDADVIDRVFDHIDNGTTDVGDEGWREPTENYRAPERFSDELELFKRLPMVYCPSAALPDVGSYVARTSAGTPIVVVRGEDRVVRAFRNGCRHRGMPVAQGSGCTKAFVCGYHGWSYRLDGRLQHVPHAAGFPDLDKAAHSLAPLHAVERHGLVFVTQEEALEGDESLDGLPTLVAPDHHLLSVSDTPTDVNWKLSMEGNLEGYHIKPTHRESFYPYGFDNLNVVETVGNHCRVTFPFRRIEKLRDVPRDQRKIDGLVTYAYTLFPNVLVAVLSSHTSMAILEPVSPSQSRFITYRLSHGDPEDHARDHQRARRDADFVAKSAKEDVDVVAAIQSSLASRANDHFTYGRFEKGIVHFHKTLNRLLGELCAGRGD